MARRLTETERNNAIALMRDGRNLTDIAQLTDISSQTLRDLAKRNNIEYVRAQPWGHGATRKAAPKIQLTAVDDAAQHYRKLKANLRWFGGLGA